MARDTYQKNFPDVPNTPEKYTEYINNQTVLSADHMSTIRDAIQADENYLVNVDTDLSEAESSIEQLNQSVATLQEEIDADKDRYNYEGANLLSAVCNVHGRGTLNGRDIMVNGCRLRKWRVNGTNSGFTTCASLLGEHFRLFSINDVQNTKDPQKIVSLSEDDDFISTPKWLNASNIPHLAFRCVISDDSGTEGNNGFIFATKKVEDDITTITTIRTGDGGNFLVRPQINNIATTRITYWRLELMNNQDESTPSFWETAIENGNLALYFCNSNSQAITNIDLVFSIVDVRWPLIHVAPIESYRAKTNHDTGDLFTMSTGRLYKTTSPIVAGSVITPNSSNNALTTVAEQLDTKVRFDMDQTLTDAQKAKARENIGAADKLLVGAELLSWDGSGYISNAVTVGTQIAMEVTSNSSYRHLVTDCLPGDRFTVTGCLGSAVVLYSFLDSSNTVLECDGAGSDRDHYVITAPAGSVKLLVQCYNVKYGSFGSVYKGVYIPKTIDNMASKGVSRDVSLIWQDGAINASGFVSSSTSKRTNGICFNPGERLIIQNTNKNVNIAIYASKNGVFEVIGDPAGAADAYTRGGGRFVLRDWTWTYYIRLGPYSGNTRPNPVSGGYITATIESADVPYDSGYYKLCGYPQIGFKRTYSNVKPMLTFEGKTIGENGIENSETCCLVTLPNCGWIEVKQDVQKIKFKIAKLTNGTITYLVDDWSYYTYRYLGDGKSTYYALVTTTPGAESGDDIMQLAHTGLGVYVYTDEGASYDNGYYLSGKHIAFIGDSITQGRTDKNGVSSDKAETTIAKPFCELVAEIAGDDNVGNYGIGGACVSDLKYSWKSLLTNCDKISGYDVVFICGGTNDYGEDIAEQDFRTAYTTVLNTLMAANTEVICCTPVYRTSKVGANSAGLWLSDYAAIIRELAETNGLKCIDLLSLTSDGCFIRFCPDKLHPNEMGHKVIADWIVQECDRLGLD